jgi:hypothetical protein
MKLTPLEREDVIRWMIKAPTYRVDFWHVVSPGDPARGLAPGYKQDSYYLADCDADEVIGWANSEAEGREVVIYLSTDQRGEPGLIRLMGEDLTFRRY